MAESFRLNFFNAPKSLHPFIASLLTAGATHNCHGGHSIRLWGNGDQRMDIGVISLGPPDEADDSKWHFTCYEITSLGDRGRKLGGFINLRDGNGCIESV